MLGWIFNGLIKRIEKTSKEIIHTFHEELSELADQLDYIAQNRIHQLGYQAEALETKTKEDIESLLNQTDGIVKSNLEKIDQIRQQTIQDTLQIISQTDYFLENRINQISLVIMKTLAISSNLLIDIKILESQIFNDASLLIDHVEEIIDKTVEQIRNELKKYSGELFPNPLDT